MSDDDGEKEHEPSQKKLEDARKKGEVVRSNDLTTAAVYAGILTSFLALGPAAVDRFGATLRAAFDHADPLARLLFSGSGAPIVAGLAGRAAASILPWLLIPALVALLTVVVLRSLVFAPTKIAPKLSRVSPVANAKNKFGRAGLFEFSKSFAKLTIYSALLGIFLVVRMPDILATLQLEPALAMAVLSLLMAQFLGLVLAIAAALAVIDVTFQRAEHKRKHRMTHRELKEELKQSDGDPAMKAQRRQKGYDIAMNRMLADVPAADVVVVNPTRYAVALKWDRQAGGAPDCVAKGVDEIAARIREIAAQHGVPIHADPPTARALFATTEVGQEIAPEHYRAVAAAIRFAEALRARMGRR